jgi:hypothetical protein
MPRCNNMQEVCHIIDVDDRHHDHTSILDLPLSTPPQFFHTMPRNQGTSRKGKPKKEMRSAGFGKALQRYVTIHYSVQVARAQYLLAVGPHPSLYHYISDAREERVGRRGSEIERMRK